MLRKLSFRGRHLLVFDVVATSLAFVMAFGLRFDAPSALFDQYFSAYAWLLPLLILGRVAAFLWLRLYQRVWRYASVEEMVSVLLAVLASSAVAYSLAFALVMTGTVAPVPGFPRSVPVIDSLLMVTFAGSWRFALRLLRIGRAGATNGDGNGAERVLVVGGEQPAIAVIRAVREDPSLHLAPVGIVADDHQVGQRLMGLPVLGRLADLGAVVGRSEADVVLFALPSADGRTLRGLVRAAEDAGARCLTVPGIAEVVAGRVKLDSIREIDVEDLLRRAPARIDLDSVSADFTGRRILITGAGGSIGGELARQLLRFAPSELLLLGRGENSIFETMQSLPEHEATVVMPVILDVRDGARLEALIGNAKPDVVFHAAAHKHVRFMEMYPEAALDTNVVGTARLLEACTRHAVERFVLISTDKAVNPRSVMGATKRAAELLVLSAATSSGKRYSIVRFGNVLSSRGSVVPVFRHELENGGPVTITHPEVSRYFMTIPEAVQLVLQAAVFAAGGEIFVLDMGEPVKILDLAYQLAALHGLELGRDVPVQFTGLRAGEKMSEELFFAHETPEATAHEAIRRVRAHTAVIDLSHVIAELEPLARGVSRAPIAEALRRLVPEYVPSNEEAVQVHSS